MQGPPVILVGMSVEVEDDLGKRTGYVKRLGMMNNRPAVLLGNGTWVYCDDIKRHVIQPHEVTVLPAGVTNPFDARWDNATVYGEHRTQALDGLKAGRPDPSLSFWWAEFTGYFAQLTDPAQVDWS